MKLKISTKTLLFFVLFAFALCGAAQAAFTLYFGGSDVKEQVAAVPVPGNDFTHLVKLVGPAVVNVSTERAARVNSMPFPFWPDFFRENPFGDDEDDFFSPFGRPRQQPQQRRQNSLGSGFIISADGYIVTNNHVIEGAEIIRVNFGSVGDKENSFEAEVIGTDKETDLALLKINAQKGLPFMKFGDSDALEVGEWVMAIGNPFGLDHTVTVGILSAKFRNIDSSSLVRFLQTDASINPGNSGGPLINMKGEVIGINTAIVPQGQGIGFAIPSTLASKIIDDLKVDRKVSRGWLGVTIQNVDSATAKALGLAKPGGVLIGGVIPGQPAEKAGIEAGDVILKIDGKDIENADELLRTIAGFRPETTIKLTIWRDSAKKDVKIILSERNAGQAAAQPGKEQAPGKAAEAAGLGLQLRPLTAQELQRRELKAGLLIVGIEQDKAAAKAGLARGDVILSINRKSVGSVDEFNKEAERHAKSNGAVLLHINRNGQQFIRAVEWSK